MSNKIPVSEHFYSIQGEGPHAGKPSVFLRTAGCNLMCGGWQNRDVESQENMEPSDDATWVCDTIEVWREPQNIYTPEELVDEWAEEGWLDRFRDGAHLIITGGEPTLPVRQKQLIELFRELESRDARPFVEVETNGTINTIAEFDAHVHHYNVSMKLSNSGMDVDERINEEAIYWYVRRFQDDNLGEAIFKFVASSEDDIEEIRTIVREFNIPDDMVYLMPAGQTQEQLRQTYPVVAEICKQEGWTFTPRLQVDTWNLATGV